MSIIKKKLVIVLVSCFIMLNLLFVISGQGKAAGLQDAKVTASILNVRSSPTTKSSIIWKLTNGQQVQITQTQNGWSKIHYPNKKDGWVTSDYLQPIKKVSYAKASVIYIRSQPAASSSVKATLHKGDAMTVLSASGNWSYIQTSNKALGWVLNSDLSSTKPSTTQAKPSTYYVSANSLYVRKQASTSAAAILTLKKNDKVTEISRSGSWSQIKFNNITGWVGNKYLTTKAPAAPSVKPVPPVTPVPPANPDPTEPTNGPDTGSYVIINGMGVNLRKGPDTTFDKVGPVVNTGQEFQKIGGSPDWVKILLPNNQEAWVFSKYVLNKPASTSGLKGKTIVLDAGHGDHDSGAVGSKMYEKNLTIITVQKVAALLKSAGANVILTRNDDTFVTLQGRVNISEKYKANAFISIHYNSGPSNGTGVESFYYSTSKDKKLAECIQKQLVQASKLPDRGVKFGDLHVVRENNQPAVLLELGFLSNPKEEAKIITEQYQNDISNAVYQGIIQYFK